VYENGVGSSVNPINANSTVPLAWSVDGESATWRARKSDTASGNVPLVDYQDPSDFPDQFGVGGDVTGRCGRKANNSLPTTSIGLDPATAFLQLVYDKFAGTDLTCVLTDLWFLERPVPS
jgi:hypothetical protein